MAPPPSAFAAMSVVAAILTASASIASGQTNQDQYTVQRSAGDSNSPIQAPPGSDEWNRQLRLSRLKDLDQQWKEYVTAQYWSALQQGIENNKNKWFKLYENIQDLVTSYGSKAIDPNVPANTKEVNEIASGKRSAIATPVPDLPVDLPNGAQPTDDPHLQSLEHALVYDAKKLGITVDSSTGTEQEMLNRLRDRIDSELKKATAALSDANVRPSPGLQRLPTEKALTLEQPFL